MTKIDFCEVMGDINQAYVEEAHTPAAKKRPVWTRWGTVAACACLCVLLGLGVWRDSLFDKTPTQEDDPHASREEIEANDGPDVQAKPVISSFAGGSASYAVPENGTFFFSIPLNDAIEHHGDDVLYRVVIDVFHDKKPLSVDGERFTEELDRLSENGYDCESIFDAPMCIVMTAELNQLTAFSAHEEYGYGIFLYDERV